MSTPLASVGDLSKQTTKLMNDQYKNLWMWLAGYAALQFATLFWVAISVPSAVADGTALSGTVFQVVGVLAIASVLVSLGLLRALVQHAMPQTRLLNYWGAVAMLLGAGILVGLMVLGASIALILPGIWLGVAFSFASLEILAGGKGIWDAIMSSFNLVKGRWWGVFGRQIVMGLCIIGFEIVAAIVFGIINWIVGLTHVAILITFVSSLLQAALAVGIAYFALCWNLSLYRSLKATYVPAPTPAKS